MLLTCRIYDDSIGELIATAGHHEGIINAKNLPEKSQQVAEIIKNNSSSLLVITQILGELFNVLTRKNSHQKHMQLRWNYNYIRYSEYFSSSGN